jgi:hypothetical protein
MFIQVCNLVCQVEQIHQDPVCGPLVMSYQIQNSVHVISASPLVYIVCAVCGARVNQHPPAHQAKIGRFEVMHSLVPSDFQ